jgi:hypothetical protein
VNCEYQIRDAELKGIFLAFDTQYEAIDYWEEKIKGLEKTDVRYGCVVVEDVWETESEAETARLNFMIENGSGEKFARACLQLEESCFKNADEWPRHARAAIDTVRVKPAETRTVIWPKKTESK